MNPTRLQQWRATNRKAVKERLAWVRQQADGILFQQELPAHTVVVRKYGSKIRLGLPCPTSEMVQSVLNLDDPFNLVAPYNQAFLLGLLWNFEPRHIFIAGVGGGCLPLVLHHHLRHTRFDCAELDEVVLTVAQRYFGLKLDHRLQVTLDDARDNLAQQGKLYDLIFVDVFMGNGYTPHHLVTYEFYQLCRARLQSTGVIVINMAHDDPDYPDKIKTLQAVFDQVYVVRVEMGNSVVIGTNNPGLSRAELMTRTRELQNYHRLAFSLTKRIYVAYLPTELQEVVPHLPEAQILQDVASVKLFS